jgi:hypothetical protein
MLLNNLTKFDIGKAILPIPTKCSTDHVFAVPNQSIPTFQLFRSVSIHNQYFKIYPGCIAFQKGGIHNNQHTQRTRGPLNILLEWEGLPFQYQILLNCYFNIFRFKFTMDTSKNELMTIYFFSHCYCTFNNSSVSYVRYQRVFLKVFVNLYYYQIQNFTIQVHSVH